MCGAAAWAYEALRNLMHYWMYNHVLSLHPSALLEPLTWLLLSVHAQLCPGLLENMIKVRGAPVQQC